MKNNFVNILFFPSNSTSFLKIICLGILCGIIISQSACTKEFIPEFQNTASEMVINSFLNNTAAVKVNITKSLPLIYQANQSTVLEELSGASVGIYEDDQFIEYLNYFKLPEDTLGYFTASFIPVIDAAYHIEVDVEESQEIIRAEATVPIGADLSATACMFIESNSFHTEFQFQDDPNKDDYYYLKMFFKGFSIDSISGEKVYVDEYRVEIPKGSLPEVQEYLDNGYLFHDRTFNGTAFNFDGIIKSSNVSNLKPTDLTSGVNGNPIQLDSSMVYIRLETLSEDAYKFKSSHALFLSRGINLSIEPSPIYSNIENGLGIFAGIHVSEKAVPVN